MTVLSALPAYLDGAIRRFRVPGASLAVFTNGELHEAAAGVINNETGVATTTDTLFQIGSITKLLTTSMTMQLVEEGTLDINAPVREVLPGFAVADESVSAAVTPAHLLSHSSGIDGDYFIDAGRGADMIDRLLEKGKSLTQLHAPGSGFSYCNYGFAVMGRVAEVIDGTDWDASFQRRIARRLGSDSMVTRPEMLLRHRTAIGHLPRGTTGELAPARQPYLPFAMGPAGTTPTCRARDLVAFARAVLAGGGELLGKYSVASMRTPRTQTVNAGTISHFGLGFMLFDWDGVPLFGHDGATVGQNSFLRIHDNGTVVVLLTNGGDVQGLAHDVLTTVFTDVCGFAPPAPVEGSPGSVDANRYAGTYKRGLTRFEVSNDKGVLTLSTGPGDAWSEGLVPQTGPFVLNQVDDETFTYRVPGAALPLSVRFIDADVNGHFTALHTGMRRNVLVS